jgi:hypothetical protein
MNAKHIGAAVAAFGFLILALNLLDYYAGRYRVADISTLVGGMCVLGGAYLALRKQ